MDTSKEKVLLKLPIARDRSQHNRHRISNNQTTLLPFVMQAIKINDNKHKSLHFLKLYAHQLSRYMFSVLKAEHKPFN